jgi:hypothetical protein
MAQHAEYGRRRFQRRQVAGIVWLAGRNHAAAQFRQGIEFARGVARRADEILAAATHRQARQFFQRNGRRPESAQPDCEVTGPTFSVRASLSQARRSLSCTAFAPMRVLAAQQPADIVAVHESDQQ